MSQDNDQENAVLTSRVSENEKQPYKDEFKLPKLGKPQSRGRVMSRKQNKAPIHLPSIISDLQSEHNFRNTQVIHVSKSENDIMQHSQDHTVRDQFTYQIEQKLKGLIGSQQSNNNEQNFQSHQQNSDNVSDDLDFQQKILQNKEIIKMHRKKTQLPDKKLPAHRPLQILQKINQSHNNNKGKFMKPQSNYQKKMKDYNMSLQNKYLQRKKQSLGIIPQKPVQKPVQRAKSKKILSLKDAAIDEAKQNFGYKQFKNNTIAKVQSSKDQPKPLGAMNVNKSHKQPPTLSQKAFQKPSFKQSHKTQQPISPSKRINKTSALFDNIQTFLQNPTAQQKHQKLYKQLYKKLKTKNLHQLQEQLKEINQKMGTNENYETKSTVGKEQPDRQILLTQSSMERTVRDWKRIDVKDKHNLQCKESDFEKELDYVSYLQEKNSNSLMKFIDQQKIMVELQISRRISKSIGKDHPIAHIAEAKHDSTAQPEQSI